jgi:hypothetical protein
MSTSTAQQASFVVDGPYAVSFGGKLVATEESLELIPFKTSGLGTAHGDEGPPPFTNPKTILVHKYDKANRHARPIPSSRPCAPVDGPDNISSGGQGDSHCHHQGHMDDGSPALIKYVRTAARACQPLE